MLRGLAVIGVVTVAAVVFWTRQCGDEYGAAAAAPADFACRDILGTWELYLKSDGVALDEGLYATGGQVVFAAGRDGRFMNMASDDRYWSGTKGCVREDGGYALDLGNRNVTFEMAEDGALHQVSGGQMSFVLRRAPTGCPF